MENPVGLAPTVRAFAQANLKDWSLRYSGHGSVDPFAIDAHVDGSCVGASGRYRPSYHTVIGRGPRFSDSLALFPKRLRALACLLALVATGALEPFAFVVGAIMR